MTNCWIFDDIYGESIYHELKELLPQLSYPVKTNIDNPIPYLPEIKNGDFIILDNFFFWEGREQPLGDDFLRQYLKLNYNCKLYVSQIIERRIFRDSLNGIKCIVNEILSDLYLQKTEKKSLI